MRKESRRSVLQATAGLAAGSALTGRVVGADDGTSKQDVIPTTPAEIREAFNDVPQLDNPTPRQRSSARNHFPDLVVPDDGPVPDPKLSHPVTLDAPPWLLATAYYKEREHAGSEVTYQSVEDRFLARRQLFEEWALPDGTDAVEAVTKAIQEEHDG